MQGILIGGIIPAVLIGIALTFLKLAGQLGITAGNSMMVISIGVLIAGTIASLLIGDGFVFPVKGTAVSIAVGLFWGTATLLMAFAVNRYNLPMSVSASIAAANALITVILSLIFFHEAESVNLIKLISGALFIIMGAILVTLA